MEMTKIPFYKYQGAGNDFILLDQRHQSYIGAEDQSKIAQLCDRRFGIGADGLMLLEKAAGYDFRMVYFNADGREGSMCGNGGRCIVAYAHFLGVFEERCNFIAIDGPHEAILSKPAYVELKMQEVQHIEAHEHHYILDTGSPHYVAFRESLEEVDVVKEGRKIRNSPPFAKAGINVNFVCSSAPNQLQVATYERGVEDETLACGTGVTAAALAYHLRQNKTDNLAVQLQVKGGQLEVRYQESNGLFHDIWLCGPAVQVFQGEIKI